MWYIKSQNFKTHEAKINIIGEINGQIHNNRDCNAQLSVIDRTTYKKLFAMHVSDKGLVPRAYKEL